MMTAELPPLEKATAAKYTYFVDTLVEGFITANSGIQGGHPCIIETITPTSAFWPWDLKDNPERLAANGLTREKVIAAYAFEMGVQWQRSRKRRLRMAEKVRERYADAQPKV